MRFGLFIPQGWRLDLVGIDPADQWAAMNGLARHADAGDWESIWVYDHFHTVPAPTTEATHEAWTLMAAFAASTSRVRLGQMCTCMAYRNPAYLAKVAATVDVISGGRVEMGIGAGWYEHEWRAYGYGFPGAGDRIAALDEGVQIMEQAWRTGEATLDGRFYQVDGARVHPRPLQAGGIPFWIAGGGERKTLRIAARSAHYTNFVGTLEGFAHKSSVLEGHCRDLGRDFGEITRSANYNVVIGRDQAEVDARLAWIDAHYRPVVPEKVDSTVEDFRTGPLVGTPEQIVERLRALEAIGMTYAITYFAEAAYDRSGIELFEREVIPALRG
ncbi:LLM class F420-dependent oxidoreductase [Actinotalea sp.]|uniref:LLM class F420-dependent oxidoreductase n=1 Tax=Actinotalea sp. TaxID=1872145 RepID=UPI002B54E6DA|nr:LLM class F420-dependent oxidoreductase [Actinotalea sp.]HQY33746.1 LLM class F420-dependent oxidoreductase [Actinotalea sp.]HRA51252.1 LLM class F420-dependent oxidoreductase [Actinotalea sp.]